MIALNEQPKPEHIASNSDGSQYIPIGFIEQYLDELTESNWTTKNFVFYTGTGDFISASIELVIQTPEINRTLVGGITFHPSEYPNNYDFVGIAISECTKNAAKKLGDKFGRSLNGRTELRQSKAEKERAKIKPDAGIMKQYMAALQSNNILAIDRLLNIYDIKVG